MRLPTRLLGMAVLMASAAVVCGEDWPQWRGPRGDGISKEILPDSLKDGLKPVWSAKVGKGYSSPIGVKGTVYVFGADGSKEGLFAFNAADGKKIWSKNYDVPGNQPQYPGTRATPLYEDGKIYTLGQLGQMTCWDSTAEGKVLWQTNILKEAGTKAANWGTASDPLLDGDRLYMQAGENGPIAVGIDKKTGKMDWKSDAKGKCGYAHPIIVDVDGAKELVVFGGKAVYGMSLDGGKTLWQQSWETSYDVNAATPLYRDSHLFVSSGYGHGGMMLKLTKQGATKEWESKEMASKFPGMILEGDYLYGNSSGKLKCLHWPDGKVVWSEDVKLNDGGSLVKAGNKILTISEHGWLSLVKVDGDKHEKLGQTGPLFDAGDVWATPLLFEGKMYAHGGDELACYDLTAGK